MSDEERGKKMSFFGGEEGKFCIFPVIRTANGGETIIRTALPHLTFPFFIRRGGKGQTISHSRFFCREK